MKIIFFGKHYLTLTLVSWPPSNLPPSISHFSPFPSPRNFTRIKMFENQGMKFVNTDALASFYFLFFFFVYLVLLPSCVRMSSWTYRWRGMFRVGEVASPKAQKRFILSKIRRDSCRHLHSWTETTQMCMYVCVCVCVCVCV